MKKIVFGVIASSYVAFSTTHKPESFKVEGGCDIIATSSPASINEKRLHAQLNANATPYIPTPLPCCQRHPPHCETSKPPDYYTSLSQFPPLYPEAWKPADQRRSPPIYPGFSNLNATATAFIPKDPKKNLQILSIEYILPKLCELVMKNY